ncbi:uncharacterized protein TRIADDRAFT_60805 [Trichoplax adhaerens]|uniref:Uncharacterized protein n=1 Tax=Trichoplax adhaerens TaxID=10228 RepID=B3S902_TRIAD|nr:predicted protein [Trichoplax adhaerens]EDV20792.1 predicted protein [Trichoplax adhaerens]|eukprot:XP_002116733.1 predicted protein [Trichoplax adhaerens]
MAPKTRVLYADETANNNMTSIVFSCRIVDTRPRLKIQISKPIGGVTDRGEDDDYAIATAHIAERKDDYDIYQQKNITDLSIGSIRTTLIPIEGIRWVVTCCTFNFQSGINHTEC